MLRSARNERLETASTAPRGRRTRMGAALASALLILAGALLALPGCGGSDSGSGSGSGSNPATEAVAKAKVGDVVEFGDYQWRVLATKDGQALIVTEDVIDVRAFNEGRDATTWEDCTLRAYLNGEFYDGLGEDQQKAVVETANANPENPDYGTSSGGETTDKVFLLSLDEANQYFDSDEARIANRDGEPCSWWLRTMGSDDYIVTYVGTGGDASRSGIFADYVTDGYGGVRPAMWVQL